MSRSSAAVASAERPVKRVADLLCGAGGTSLAARNALDELGYEMDLVCVNHWPVAIATHEIHFPTARHYCQDIATVRPHLAVPEGHLDLLAASPTCTHHSRARGGKPTSDQQRSDPWHIVTWLTELRVDRLFIENVPEFVDWGPVDPATGKPIKARKGEYFRQWVATLRGLGFVVEWRIQLFANWGDATTRKRFLLLGRSDGKPITWPEPTHAKAPASPAIRRWRPARDCIDWSIPGKSIFTRPRPLSPNTLFRIHAGLVKFGWPEPFLIVLRQHMAARGLDLPLPTITTSGRHIGIVQPVLFQVNQGEGRARNLRGVDEPMPTIVTRDSFGLIAPFIATLAHGAEASESDPHTRRARGIDEPLQTIHAGGGKFALIEPFVLSQASGGAPRGVGDPMQTVPGGGAHALIAPYYGSGSGESCSSADEPLPTVTTRDRFGLVVPITHASPDGRGDGRARTVDDPLPTLTGANRGELALIVANRTNNIAKDVDRDPVPTITSSGNVALVEGVGFDILYRMLQPHELAAASSLMDAGKPLRFSGTKTDINKQIGNAVPERTARAHIRELMRA